MEDNPSLKNSQGLYEQLESLKKDQDVLLKSIPKVATSQILWPKIDTSHINKALEEISKAREEEIKREVENNENLKALVNYNKQLVDYNQQLVSLNESILRRINIVGEAMENIIEGIREGNQSIKELNTEQTKLLLELINILESKDNRGKLADFLKQFTGDVAAGLVTAYLQLKLGLL